MSTASPKLDLVSFARPPVSEVSLALQFEADVVDLDALALFSNAVRKKLPVRERQPRLPSMEETFDVAPHAPPFSVQLQSPTELPRTWFLSENGTRLVQVQGDRLVLNWRRMNEKSRYPRYRALRKELNEYLDALEEAVRKVSGRLGEVNFCEVMYVNAIDPPGKTSTAGHPDLSGVLNLLRPLTRRGKFLGRPEDAVVQSRWRIPGDELKKGLDRPAGRLYLSVAPGLKPADNRPIYLMSLTGRLMPVAGNRQSAMKALDVAHKWIVLGFEDLTTDKMHELWGHRMKP